jgi:uncharacterized protein
MTKLSDASLSIPAEPAALLLTDPVIRPWYREPWPWLLAAIPFATVIAGGFTLSLAISTEDSLVADDYYKRGLAINRDIAREQAANRLGIDVRLRFTATGGRVIATLPADAPQAAALVLRLQHPTRSAMDVTARLDRVSPSTYAGAVRPVSATHWRVTVEDPEGVWRLSGAWDTDAPELALRATKLPD